MQAVILSKLHINTNKNIMRSLLTLLAFMPLLSQADTATCDGPPLTYKSFYQVFDNVTANRKVNVVDNGDYVLVTTESSRSYAFTKDINPAHPSYIEMQFAFNDSGLYLNTTGKHSKNCDAYILFKDKASEVVDASLKRIVPGTGDK